MNFSYFQLASGVSVREPVAKTPQPDSGQMGGSELEERGSGLGWRKLERG